MKRFMRMRLRLERADGKAFLTNPIRVLAVETSFRQISSRERQREAGLHRKWPGRTGLGLTNQGLGWINHPQFPSQIRTSPLVSVWSTTCASPLYSPAERRSGRGQLSIDTN